MIKNCARAPPTTAPVEVVELQRLLRIERIAGYALHRIAQIEAGTRAGEVAAAAYEQCWPPDTAPHRAKKG